MFLAKEHFHRIYVAFRGTASTEDWKDNLKAFQEEGSSVMKIIRGRLHSGFLLRAKGFPADKILNDEGYRGRDIVVCGHSLGGAVATVVSIVLMLEVERRRNAGADDRRNVSCITFGAPMIGDSDLRSFCEVNGIAENLFHFVNDQDPVPRLLSYAHSLSAFSRQLDNQVRSLSAAFPTTEGASFYEDQRRQWIKQKDHYVDLLSKVFLPHYLFFCICVMYQLMLLNDTTLSRWRRPLARCLTWHPLRCHSMRPNWSSPGDSVASLWRW